MTQTAAVVTRYFGGVKLGVRGLMEAYAESVKQTIDMEELKKLTQTIRLEIQLPYGVNDTVINLLKTLQVRILNTAYTDRIVHHIEIEKNRYAQVENLLMEFQSQGKLNFQVLPGQGN
jgi:putative IMPACT (imprinted ancient) family translation regulator